MNEYLCVSIVRDARGVVALLKHTEAPHTFAEVVTQDASLWVMGEKYVLNFVRSPGTQEASK